MAVRKCYALHVATFAAGRPSASVGSLYSSGSNHICSLQHVLIFFSILKTKTRMILTHNYSGFQKPNDKAPENQCCDNTNQQQPEEKRKPNLFINTSCNNFPVYRHWLIHGAGFLLTKCAQGAQLFKVI